MRQKKQVSNNYQSITMFYVITRTFIALPPRVGEGTSPSSRTAKPPVTLTLPSTTMNAEWNSSSKTLVSHECQYKDLKLSLSQKKLLYHPGMAKGLPPTTTKPPVTKALPIMTITAEWNSSTTSSLH